MPKKNRIAIYELLFKEGVMVAEQDFHLPSHPELEGVPNLHVIKALQSLKSRGYVNERFAWRHYYWYLTNKGIEYLRDFLHIPPEIVPATLKKQSRAADMGLGMRRSQGPKAAAEGKDDREAYRHAAAGGEDKEAGAGEAQLEFRGGFGRGKAAQ